MSKPNINALVGQSVDMPKDALPERYEVTKRGTPDPTDAQYYVLDHAHDLAARITLRALVRYYRQNGQMIAADELELALERSQPAFEEMIKRRNAAKSPAKKSASRTRKQDFTPA